MSDLTPEPPSGYAVPAGHHDPLRPGTPVLAWPGSRESSPLVTRTRSEVWAVASGDRVVMVEGYAGGIALTHIDVLPEPPSEHKHEWKRHQNVTTRGYALPAYEACACGMARTTPEPPSIDAAHLAHQREWSRQTFGPGQRLGGVLDHIRKELVEVEASPDDATEWADVLILAFDGAWRSGHEPQEVIDAIKAKQAENEARTWPDWRGRSEDEAIEHVEPVSSAGGDCAFGGADDTNPSAGRAGEVTADELDTAAYWQGRFLRMQAMYRERFNEGLSAEDWHRKHCGLMNAPEVTADELAEVWNGRTDPDRARHMAVALLARFDVRRRP